MMNIKKQQGASVLEFLIVIPVLLMFILLVSEVGIIFYTMNSLTKSTQDAARYISEVEGEYDVRKAVAQNLLIYGRVTATGSPLLPNGDTLLSSTITKVGPATDTHVSVVVTYQHDLIMGSALGGLTGLSTGGGVGFGDTFTLTASSVMRFTL